jgi:phosphohistidine swiveling domain-containing protein
MSFCIRLADVRVEDPAELAAVGGKARSLSRLAAAGLPIPPAFVVTSRLFRALRAAGPPLPEALADAAAVRAAEGAVAALVAAPWPAGFEAELTSAIARLGAQRFAVRSSAALEDRADALGAGIFLSRTDVAARDVPDAVREVLASALAPAAQAYAARRGLPAEALAMAVLVHPYTPGDAAGTAAFDPGKSEAPSVEPTSATRPSPAAHARVAAAARALAANGEAVEIEWVATGDDAIFLQLRPHAALVPRPWHESELADGHWTWDAAHNPLPLSPAQAGLVALVDARCRVAFRQRVVGGYLFFSPAPRESGGGARPSAGDALRAVAATADAGIAALGPEASLEQALELFVRIYQPLYGVVQPAAREARDALASFLARHGRIGALGELLRGVPSLATERAQRAAAIASTSDPTERTAAIAAYVERFGDEAPVWDVATPTYAEDPGALAQPAPAPSLATTAAGELDLPAAARAEGRALIAAARDAAAAAEDDDVVYARVQSRVRHALLREGRRLQAANRLARPDDVFWLPLEDVRRDARGEGPLTLAAVTHAVAAARAQHEAALSDPPPLRGAHLDGRPGGVRGKPASGGRALGRVHVHAPGGAAVPPGAILVARTLLPTELPLVAPAAVVVETGGTLGHVAAQARERGLPAIVDAPGASTAFRAGDQVLVDADAGVAIRVG